MTSTNPSSKQVEPELKACPFCPYPTENYYAIRAVGWLRDQEMTLRIVVVCSRCGAQGPAFGVMSFNNEETAAQYWNRRNTRALVDSAAPTADKCGVCDEYAHKKYPRYKICNNCWRVIPWREDGRVFEHKPYPYTCATDNEIIVTPATAPLAAPQGEAFTAYNQAIEDAKNAIRCEKVDDPYAAATFINAIARKCSPHRYVAQLAVTVAPSQLADMAEPKSDSEPICTHCGREIEKSEYGPPINDISWSHIHNGVVWCQWPVPDVVSDCDPDLQD